MNAATAIKKPPVYRLIRLQIITSILIMLPASYWGVTAAVSAAVGGLIVVAGNGYFCWRAFHYYGTRDAGKVLGSFYRAEIGKFILMVIMLALVFRFMAPLNTVTLLLGFVVNLLVATISAAFLLHPAKS